MKSKDPLTDPDQVHKIEEQFQQQNAIIDNLQKENQDMQAMIAQKDNETIEWRNLVEEYQKRITKLRPAAKENKKLRRMNKEKKGELMKIRQELLLLRSKTSPEVKQKVDEMMRKQDDLAGKVGNNKAKINTLKKDKNKLQEQKKDLLERIEEVEGERDQLYQDLEEERNLKKKFEELYSEEREKNLAMRQHLDQLTKEDKKPIPRNQSSRPKSASKYGRKNDSNNATNNHEDVFGTQDDFGSNASAEKEILLNRINFADIEAIAIELRETLRTKKVPYTNLKMVLPAGEITLTELKDLLLTDFHIEETDALMTARYIFEDDDLNESKVIFEEDKQMPAEEVAEKLKKFVCLNGSKSPYKLSDDEIEESVKESIEGDKHEEFKKEAKRQLEEDEEIDENYSDVDDFEEEKVYGGDQHRPDSPKIEDEPEPQTNNVQSDPSPEKEEVSESEIDEDRGLEIAEECFSKIAQLMKSKNTTVINHFKDYIASQVAETEDGQEFEIVYIHPMGFLEGLQNLGLELSPTETK